MVDVEFQGENPLPDDVRARLISEIQQLNLSVEAEDPSSSWVNEAVQPIRTWLLDRGYFKTSVEGTPYLVSAKAHEQRYALSIVIERGPQYRLGGLRFANMTAFTESDLRKLFPLEAGDLFDVSKIRQGLEAVSRLYGGKGYIDATAELNTTVDEEKHLISLLINLDENVEYRVGNVQIRGLPPTAESALRSRLESGQLFNATSFRKTLEENKNNLPAAVSLEPRVRVSRDVNNGTVDISLDLRHCPQT